MGGYCEHIANALDGDQKAFADIVALFGDMARSVAQDRLGDASLAQDAVQEAFLTAYLNLPRLRDHAAFPGWFRTILVRQCASMRRRMNQEPLAHIASMEDAASDEDGCPYRAYTRQLDQDMVRRILAGLPGPAREACILRFVHGQRYGDIAKVLGVPKGTVKRRIHDARNRIIAELKSLRRKIIRVGYLPISDHLLAMVANARNGSADFEINLSRFLSWGGLVKALLGGALDAAFIMAPLAMSLFNKGAPLAYVLDGHHDGSAITVRKDMSGRDLFGARLGLPHAASTQSMYLHAMMENGRRPESEAPGASYISPSYLDRHFAERRIDGFFCAEPWNSKSEVEGLGRVLARSRDFAPGHVCCGLTVRTPFAANNGDLLHAYVGKLLAAAEFAAARPGECARIQARHTGISRDIAGNILEKGFITFRDLAPDRSRLEQSMRMAMRSSILDRPCDLSRFIRPEYAS